MIPCIALTPGEPAGIGPDLCIRIARQAWDADLVVVADPDLLVGRARQLGLPLQLQVMDHLPDSRADILESRTRVGSRHRAGTLKVLPVPLAAPVRCGHTNPANAPYVLETLRIATRACLRGQCDALVTGPVQKSIINEAGIVFTGHTEFLAELTRTPQVVMMLVVPGLRVALATTHLPLREVSDAITAPGLEAVIRVLHHDLRTRLGVVDPHILVCGLNPHAGESGHLGTEDQQIIVPVLEKLRGLGMRLTGPLPADTLFIPKYLQTADVVLAMYHDQGLPVLKYAGFGRAVNITLGLPVIRTSVDHGTALDLAGTGQADVGSLEAAIQAALEMVSHRIK